MKRRDFLKSTSGLALTVALPVVAKQVRETPKIKLDDSYYTKPLLHNDHFYCYEVINSLDTSTLKYKYRLGMGDIRLPLQVINQNILRVQIGFEGIRKGTYQIVDKDCSIGPRIKIYNFTGLPCDAVIDAYITTVGGVNET